MVSIRSKKKKHFRAIRREEVFGPVESKRLERLSKLQAEAALAPPIITSSNTTSSSSLDNNTNSNSSNSNDNAMETDKPIQKLTKAEREAIMLSRNQYKKKQRARAKSAAAAAASNRGISKRKRK